jgi:hypothetical protein
MNRLQQILRVPLEHIFGAAFIVYLGILLVCLRSGVPDREYLATRDLAPNHRIAAVDVQRPATLATSTGFYMASLAVVEGRYLKQSVKRAERISVAIVADRPSMRFPDSFRAIAFPLQIGSMPVDLIDVGSPVILLGRDADSKCRIAVAATVHAIVCEQKTGDAPNCYPMLRVPADKSQVVVTNQSALHLALLPQPQP